MAAGRILVVDDDPDICEVVGMVLESYGYDVMAAADGRQALDRLRTGVLPHLILLDLMMPVMDGLEFMATRDLDPSLSSIPVVVISGDVGLAQKASKIGASSYLKKPVELTELVAAVKRHAPGPAVASQTDHA